MIDLFFRQNILLNHLAQEIMIPFGFVTLKIASCMRVEFGHSPWNVNGIKCIREFLKLDLGENLSQFLIEIFLVVHEERVSNEDHGYVGASN